jgi:hypothetical protein
MKKQGKGTYSIIVSTHIYSSKEESRILIIITPMEVIFFVLLLLQFYFCQVNANAYDVILQWLGFGPCVDQPQRCGFRERGYKMIQTNEDSGLCVEICSTMPYLNIGYECGTCKVTCPDNEMKLCLQGIGMKMFRLDGNGICDDICVLAGTRADGYSCGECDSPFPPTPITTPNTPPSRRPSIIAPETPPIPIATPITPPVKDPTVPIAPVTPSVPLLVTSTPSVPPSSLQYDITLDLINLTAADRIVFENAAALWESVITGDLPDLQSSDFDTQPAVEGCKYPESVDDLYICGIISEIDGVGMVAGRARPTFVRTASGGRLPSAGEMIFDSADIDALREQGLIGALVAHEMGHVLGKKQQIWQALHSYRSIIVADCKFNLFFKNILF